jgi:hypothetical protein
MNKETKTIRSSPIASPSVGTVDISPTDFTYLQTTRVWITGPTGLSRLTRCVLEWRETVQLYFQVSNRRPVTLSDSTVEFVCYCFVIYHTAPGRRRSIRCNMRGTGTNASTLLTALENTQAFSHHPSVPHDIMTLARILALRLADPPGD